MKSILFVLHNHKVYDINIHVNISDKTLCLGFHKNFVLRYRYLILSRLKLMQNIDVICSMLMIDMNLLGNPVRIHGII